MTLKMAERLEQKVRKMHLKRGDPIEIISWDYGEEPGVRIKETRSGYYIGIESQPNRSSYDWENNGEHTANCRRNGEVDTFMLYSHCKEDALSNHEVDSIGFDNDGTGGLVSVKKMKYL